MKGKKLVVRKGGLEPPRLAALEPKAIPSFRFFVMLQLVTKFKPAFSGKYVKTGIQEKL